MRKIKGEEQNNVINCEGKITTYFQQSPVLKRPTTSIVHKDNECQFILQSTSQKGLQEIVQPIQGYIKIKRLLTILTHSLKQFTKKMQLTI